MTRVKKKSLEVHLTATSFGDEARGRGLFLWVAETKIDAEEQIKST
jgi:hypothetical protein